MADEVNASFVVPGEPSAILAAWRADPPSFLSIDGYKQIDDSYESLVYEANVTTSFVKITTFGFGKTVYRLTFTFRAGADGVTQVSGLGQALERTRDAFGRWLAGLPAS
jgi:hypothetical protein